MGASSSGRGDRTEECRWLSRAKRPDCPRRWGRSITSCTAERPTRVPARASSRWKSSTPPRTGTASGAALRMRVAEPGSLRQVFGLAEVMVQSPLDIARPLWTATLIEGLADGKAATLLHLSHAVTDGVGSVEMFAQIYDLERDAPPQPAPAQPIPQDLSANDLMREGFNRLPANVVGGVLGALSGVVSTVGRAVLNPG